MTNSARLVRFWLVGLGGIAVQLGTLVVLSRHLHYLPAATLAVLAALAHNFAWHRAWTWADRRDQSRAIPAFARFVAANGLVSLAGNAAVMVVLTGWWHVPALPANAMAILVCGLANFLVADRLVFSATSRQTPPSGIRRSWGVAADVHCVSATTTARSCTTTTSATHAIHPPRSQTSAGSAAPALPPA